MFSRRSDAIRGDKRPALFEGRQTLRTCVGQRRLFDRARVGHGCSCFAHQDPWIWKASCPPTADAENVAAPVPVREAKRTVREVAVEVRTVALTPGWGIAATRTRVDPFICTTTVPAFPTVNGIGLSVSATVPCDGGTDTTVPATVVVGAGGTVDVGIPVVGTAVVAGVVVGTPVVVVAVAVVGVAVVGVAVVGAVVAAGFVGGGDVGTAIDVGAGVTGGNVGGGVVTGARVATTASGGAGVDEAGAGVDAEPGSGFATVAPVSDSATAKVDTGNDFATGGGAAVDLSTTDDVNEVCEPDEEVLAAGLTGAWATAAAGGAGSGATAGAGGMPGAGAAATDGETTLLGPGASGIPGAACDASMTDTGGSSTASTSRGGDHSIGSVFVPVIANC